MNKRIPLIVFRSLALGLSIGVLTLIGMDKISFKDAIYLLALAVTCLAASSLGDVAKKE